MEKTFEMLQNVWDLIHFTCIPPSFVEFLSISKDFLTVNKQGSSAKLETFKWIKIFTVSQIWLDLIQINLNHSIVSMGSFISFLFSRVTVNPKCRSGI